MLVGDQAGVQAEPAEQRDRAQDREPVAVDVVDQPQHLLPLALQVALVDPTVPRVELDGEHLLLLGGEFGGHLLLGPPADQRPDPAAQPGQQLGASSRRARSASHTSRGSGSGSGNSPDAVIDSSDHSSIRLFSIGVPVIASLNGAGSRRAHW